MSATHWVAEPGDGYPPPVTAPTPTRIRPVERLLIPAHCRAMDADPSPWQAHFRAALRSDRWTREREESIQ